MYDQQNERINKDRRRIFIYVSKHKIIIFLKIIKKNLQLKTLTVDNNRPFMYEEVLGIKNISCEKILLSTNIYTHKDICMH